MGYTSVCYRSSPRAQTIKSFTLCEVTLSQIMAFNARKDGSYFLVRCFKSVEIHLNFFWLFHFFHANQENRRSAKPSQLSNDWDSPYRKMILPSSPTNYVRSAWPPLSTSTGHHNYVPCLFLGPFSCLTAPFLVPVWMGCSSFLELPDSPMMVNLCTFSYCSSETSLCQILQYYEL